MKKIQSMTKRKTLTAVLSLLIAFVMLISMTPMAAYAEGETGDPSDPGGHRDAGTGSGA